MIVQTDIKGIIRAPEGSVFWYEHHDSTRSVQQVHARIQSAAVAANAKISTRHFMAIDADRNIIDIFKITVVKQGAEKKQRGRPKGAVNRNTTKRDKEMHLMAKEGHGFVAIGKLHKLSRERVMQICRRVEREENKGGCWLIGS